MGNLKYIIPLIAILFGCKQNNLPRGFKESNTQVQCGDTVIAIFNDPEFTVHIDKLGASIYEVNNLSFQKFVDETGYVTQAEKDNGGMVFNTKTYKWEFIRGANWKHPWGPHSNLKGKEKHPVVQVTYADACAYCKWMGMRLPTEAEFEYLHLVNEKKGEFNHWQGTFPTQNTVEDGFKKTSPVGSFSKGSIGLFDLNGNVWEWCLDYYHQNWMEIGLSSSLEERSNGPSKSFFEPSPYDTLRVIKGGSFLCAENYCRGYESGARMQADPNLGYEHVGFRCIKTLK